MASTTTGAATIDLQAAGRCPCRDLDRSVALGRPRTAEHAMCPPPCLINTVGSKAGQGRDRGGSGWLGCLRTYRPAVVLSECKATCPIMVSVSMLLLDFQHRSGIFARTHKIPLFSWPRDIGEFN